MHPRTSTKTAILAALASIAGAGYLVWRVGFTLSGSVWLAVPLVAAEAVLYIRFVLRLAAVAPEPGPGVAPVGHTANGRAVAATVEVLIPAAHADADSLARTLAVAAAESPKTIRVLDDEVRPDMQREALRHNVRYEALGETEPAALVEAARVTSTGDVIAWIDAGDVAVPGFLALSAAFGDDPKVAVVQSAVDLINRDSLMHLSPRHDEPAIENRVAGPSLDRAGAATWSGSGSLVRLDALEQIGGLGTHGGSATARAALRLARVGGKVRFCSEPMVRTVAPDTLSEYVIQARDEARNQWRVLATADSPLRRGAGVRRTLSQLHSSTAVLDGWARFTMLVVLAVVLLSGRSPIDAPMALLLSAFVLQFVLRSAANVALARGTLGLGDNTRRGLRLMGAHMSAVVGAAAPGPRASGSGERWAALGRLRLLTTMLVVLDIGLLARGLTLISPDLLPAFDGRERVVAMGAAVWAVIAIIDVLHVLVARVQRRAHHRSGSDLVAEVDEVSCRTVDLTPHGVGLILREPIPVDTVVELQLVVPRLDGSFTRVVATGRIGHVADQSDDCWRAGAMFTSMDDYARDALIEFCALTAELRDDGRDQIFETTPEELQQSGGSTSRRALAMLSVAGLALAGPFVMAGPSAGAKDLDSRKASVSGTVLDPGGRPAAGACVGVWNDGAVPTVTTAEDGTFTLDAVAAGDQVIYAEGCGSGDYFTTFASSTPWQNRADKVSVKDGEAVGGVKVALMGAGQISGRAVDPDGRPVANVCVNLVSPDGQWDALWVGNTDGDGNFSGRVPAGEPAKLQFNDCSYPPRFASTWFPGTNDASTAKLIEAASGTKVSLPDTTMQPGATVAGTVTDATGAPVANACVSAQVVTDSEWRWVGGANTDEKGGYNFIVPPGEYSLWFNDCDGVQDDVAGWYPDSPSWTRPPPTVKVGVGANPSFDHVMTRGASLRGEVTDVAGKPARGVCVNLMPAEQFERGEWDSAAWTQVLQDGTWQVGPVLEGRYYVQYSNCDEQGRWTERLRWIPEIHDDVAMFGSWDRADATAVDVTSEATKPLSAELVEAAHIKGAITDAVTGEALSDVCVSFSDAGHEYREQATGKIDLAMTPGKHTITFSDCSPGRGLIQQTQTLELAPGQSEALDVAMQKGAPGAISGTVLTGTGRSLQPSCVVAYVPDDLIGVAVVAPDGGFRIDGLGAGSYWLGVFSCSDDPSVPMVDPDTGAKYPASWYPGVPIGFVDDGPPTLDGAEMVPVTAGSDVTRSFCFGKCTKPEAPGTSVPGTSVPGASVPPTSVPGTSVPGTSVPGTSVPPTNPVKATTPPTSVASPTTTRSESPTKVPEASSHPAFREGLVGIGSSAKASNSNGAATDRVAPVLQGAVVASREATREVTRVQTAPKADVGEATGEVDVSSVRQVESAPPLGEPTASTTPGPSASEHQLPWGIALLTITFVALLLVWRRQRRALN